MEDKYFVWDPVDHDLLTFATKEEQQKGIEETIEYCKDNDGMWMDEIDEVVAGVITLKATQIHRTNRPKDIPLDEDGFDEGTGYIWPKGRRYSCLYEMKPLDSGKDPC